MAWEPEVIEGSGTVLEKITAHLHRTLIRVVQIEEEGATEAEVLQILKETVTYLEGYIEQKELERRSV